MLARWRRGMGKGRDGGGHRQAPVRVRSPGFAQTVPKALAAGSSYDPLSASRSQKFRKRASFSSGDAEASPLLGRQSQLTVTVIQASVLKPLDSHSPKVHIFSRSVT